LPDNENRYIYHIHSFLLLHPILPRTENRSPTNLAVKSTNREEVIS